MVEQKIVTIEGKYIFNTKEKADLSLELANKTNMKAEVEGQKKARMSDYKQQLDQISSEIRSLSINLVRGYEFRNFRCTVEKNFKKKIKLYRDATTGEIVDERPLSQADYQIEMDDVRADTKPIDQKEAEKKAKQQELEKQGTAIIKAGKKLSKNA